MDQQGDLYAVLGVDADVDANALAVAYQRRTRELERTGHDDRALQQVHAAYLVLADPDRRATYDRLRRPPEPGKRWRWPGRKAEETAPAQDRPAHAPQPTPHPRADGAFRTAPTQAAGAGRPDPGVWLGHSIARSLPRGGGTWTPEPTARPRQTTGPFPGTSGVSGAPGVSGAFRVSDAPDGSGAAGAWDASSDPEEGVDGDAQLARFLAAVLVLPTAPFTFLARAVVELLGYTIDELVYEDGRYLYAVGAPFGPGDDAYVVIRRSANPFSTDAFTELRDEAERRGLRQVVIATTGGATPRAELTMRLPGPIRVRFLDGEAFGRLVSGSPAATRLDLPRVVAAPSGRTATPPVVVVPVTPAREAVREAIASRVRAALGAAAAPPDARDVPWVWPCPDGDQAAALAQLLRRLGTDARVGRPDRSASARLDEGSLTALARRGIAPVTTGTPDALGRYRCHRCGTRWDESDGGAHRRFCPTCGSEAWGEHRVVRCRLCGDEREAPGLSGTIDLGRCRVCAVNDPLLVAGVARTARRTERPSSTGTSGDLLPPAGNPTAPPQADSASGGPPRVSAFAAPPSASAPTGALPDTSAPTGALPDTSAPTGALPDISAPTGALPDISAPTGALPDISAPTGALPRAGVSAGALPAVALRPEERGGTGTLPGPNPGPDPLPRQGHRPAAGGDWPAAPTAHPSTSGIGPAAPAKKAGPQEQDSRERSGGWPIAPARPAPSSDARGTPTGHLTGLGPTPDPAPGGRASTETTEGAASGAEDAREKWRGRS